MRYPGFIDYAPLTDEDMKVLQRVRAQRWYTNKRRLQITYGAPLVLYGGLLLLIFLTTGWPHHLHEVLTYSVFLIPGYFLVTLANIYLWAMTMWPINKDIRRGQKALIVFDPEPYMVEAENVSFYAKTGLPDLPFVEVGLDVYQYLDVIDEMILELSPHTRIVLGIKTPQQAGIERVS